MDREFPYRVYAEMDRARCKHPPINSLHEGYAVILEELEEFWQEVKGQTPDTEVLLTELVHVAAMCQRVAEDCNLVEKEV